MQLLCGSAMHRNNRGNIGVMIELTDELLIGQGASRKCYQHPHDPDKCIKVPLDSAGIHHNQHDLDAYLKLKGELGKFICCYEPQMVETNLGPGLVSELLRDVDGEISESLFDYLKHGNTEEVVEMLGQFFLVLLQKKLYFYDFNQLNFVVQCAGESPSLKYIDIKGYRRSKSGLGLENWLGILARRKMKRRMNRLFKRLAVCPDGWND